MKNWIAALFLIACSPDKPDADETGIDDVEADTDTDSDTDTDTDTDSDTDTDTDTDSDTDTVVGGDSCDPLPAPSGETLTVSPGEVLRSLELTEGLTVLLEDGTYDLDGDYFWIDVPGVTIRAASGDASAVVLDGGYATTSIVNVSASDVTITDLTIQRAYNHPIHVTGGSGGHADRVRIHRVTIVDPAEQAIKINGSGAGWYTNDGEISCSTITLTDAGRSEVRNNCYTGGIDAHGSRNLHIRDNTISGFWCDSGLSEHGIHLWRGCRDPLIERNVVLNSARGIGLGLSDSGASGERSYEDDPCPSDGYVGHFGGIVRNNVVFVDDARIYETGSGFDGGIALAAACGVSVVHNTVYSTKEPFASIEWRFDSTTALVANNLVSHNLRDRGGEARLVTNLDGATADWFVDVAGQDVRLAVGSAARGAGTDLDAGLCAHDLDGDTRGSPPDVGADEAE